MKSLIFLASLIAIGHCQLLSYDSISSNYQPVASNQDNVFVAVYQRPRTNFDCVDRAAGQYYADLSTKCVVYHICLPIGPGGRLEPHGFACPKGKLFNERSGSCQPAETTICESKFRPISNLPAFESPVLSPVPQGPVLSSPLSLPPPPPPPPAPTTVPPTPTASPYLGSIAKSKNYLAYLDNLQEMLNRIKAKRGFSSSQSAEHNQAQQPIRSYKLNRPTDSVGVGEVPITLSNSIQSSPVGQFRAPVNVPVWIKQERPRPLIDQNQLRVPVVPQPNRHHHVQSHQLGKEEHQFVPIPQFQFTHNQEEHSQPDQLNPIESTQPQHHYGSQYLSPVQLRPAPVYEQPQPDEELTSEAPAQPEDTDPGYVELPPVDSNRDESSGAAHMGYMDSDAVYATANDQERPTTLTQVPAHDSAKYFMIKLRKKIIKTTVNDGMPPALDPPGSYEQLRPHVTMPDMSEAMPYAGAQNLYETSGANATATGPGQDDHVFMLSHYSMLTEEGQASTPPPIEDQSLPSSSSMSNVDLSSSVEYSSEPESVVQPEVTQFENGWRGTTPGPESSATLDQSESQPEAQGSEAIEGTVSSSNLNNLPHSAFQLIEKFHNGFRVAAVFDHDMRPMFTAASGTSMDQIVSSTTTEAPVTESVRFDDDGRQSDQAAAGSSLSEVQEPEGAVGDQSTGSIQKARQFLLPIPGPDGKPKAYIVLSRKTI